MGWGPGQVSVIVARGGPLVKSGIHTRERTHAQIQQFFDGLELLEPGLVRPPLWRPEGPDDVLLDWAEPLSTGERMVAKDWAILRIDRPLGLERTHSSSCFMLLTRAASCFCSCSRRSSFCSSQDE